MLWRYAGEPASNYSLGAYTDADSVSSWAEPAMRWAVENGIITGVTDSTLEPQGTATRAQCGRDAHAVCGTVKPKHKSKKGRKRGLFAIYPTITRANTPTSGTRARPVQSARRRRACAPRPGWSRAPRRSRPALLERKRSPSKSACPSKLLSMVTVSVSRCTELIRRRNLRPSVMRAQASRAVFEQVAEDDAQLRVGDLLRFCRNDQPDIRLHAALAAQRGVVGDDGVHRLILAVRLRRGGDGVEQLIDVLLLAARRPCPPGRGWRRAGGRRSCRVPPQLRHVLQHQRAVLFLLGDLRLHQTRLQDQPLAQRGLLLHASSDCSST